ncbi:ERI1 exoribonuclease 2-like [Octopus vulgaris]|uniref:ERI1 exoribonuclease 2-like n=1 Tax=Octopus vulgaris TaxID=6645 RepID=A0AA36FF67_OCTVU|nr:ERI1 exoribonuclease 2-like [Octopus vulgaris]
MKSTKELARELGFLRKRLLTSPANKKVKRHKIKQTFDYLIVMDFESTCWSDTKLKPQEIIEFPAVLLNTSTGIIVAEFQQYVMPEECPTLSKFCQELTGISQHQVDNGVPLRLCLKIFKDWLKKLSREKGIKFSPIQEDQSGLTTFVTWSDWDLSLCLRNECRRKQLWKPVELNQWIDLRATYKNFYSRKPNGLNGALQELGISFQGRQHSESKVLSTK